MGLLARAVLAAAAAVLAAPACGLAQTWDPPIPLGASGLAAPPQGVPLGGGGYAVIYEDPALGVVVHTADGDGTDFDTQVLDRSGAFPSVAADDGGEATASVAIDDQGEAVVGYEQSGVAYAVVRTAGSDGAWQPPQVLGGPWSGLSASALEVGIDANGGAVAVWDESGASTLPQVASVLAAFRPPGGVFAGPESLIATNDTEPFSLAVSAFGEVILAARQVDPLTGELDPLVAISGSTVLGRFGAPSPLSATWEEFDPTVAIDARGDAVLTTQRNDTPELLARRRTPFGAFGPPAEIVPPPYAPLYDSEGIARQITDVALDEFGNAVVTWTDAADEAPIEVSLDGPLVTAAPGVTPPDPLALAELVVPDQTDASPGSGLPTAVEPPAAESPAAPAAADRPAQTGGRLSLVIEHGPAVTGNPRFVVAVRCPAACRASLRAILITPSKHRLALPAIALTMRGAGAVSGSLRLSPAVRSALRARSASAAKGYSTRRFELTVTATAGDAAGDPQSAVARLSFARR